MVTSGSHGNRLVDHARKSDVDDVTVAAASC
jgi:hypothetical protein